MRNVFGCRPSASMIVAVLALVLAASGTAVAASKLVSGDSLIKKHSLSGNRLRNHTITGKQINMGKLGAVPSATAIGKLYYRSVTLTVPGTSSYNRATKTVACPAGTFVTGGGATSADEGSAGPTDYLIDSYPTASRTGWTVTMENESPTYLNEKVWAVCVAASTTG
jgi:hypothetical protein